MGDLRKSRELPELPEHLIEEKILEWLPLESLCRFRSVSKRCNAFISSTKFITSKWMEKAPNRNPWLLVQDVGSRPLNCLAYFFSTRSWRNTSCISFPFFVEKKEKVKFVTYYASGAGLFLHTIYPAPYVFVVSNPLTRTSLKLTPLSSITIFSAGGIVEGDGDNRGTYKVIVVGENSQEAGIVEIYDSTDKSWKIAGHLPQDVHIDNKEMVFCAGSFYCLASIHDQQGIIGFNIREGTSVFSPLPEMADGNNMSPYLLTCGSWVLVAGCIFGNSEELSQVIVWGFEKEKVNSSSSTSSLSSSWWKEIARMPPSLFENFKKISIDCNKWCIGVGDCTCFIVSGHRNRKFRKVTEVVVYSLTENTWSWLPNRPLDSTTSTSEGHELVMAFEPRLDMKVG